jgi:tRNA 2-thiouridine synthesizing protein A
MLQLALKAADMKPGDILEVLGDCPTFETDIRKWCERMNRILLAVNNNGNGVKKVQIQF